MTREAVRQWHVSRTQSVAHTLALMDRDGLFNTPQDRGRSSTLGGNAATAVSPKRSELKLTRSRSMPQQGSGRHEIIQDMDTRDSENRRGCLGEDRPSSGVGDERRPKSEAPDEKSAKLHTPAVQQPIREAPRTDADRLMQTGHKAQGMASQESPQLNPSSPRVATEQARAEAMASQGNVGRQGGSSNRQVSDAASMSGRAYARAPSLDMQRHSDSGAVSGNGSVIIHNVPASVGGNGIHGSMVATEQLPQVQQLMRQPESSAREEPPISVSRQDVP